MKNEKWSKIPLISSKNGIESKRWYRMPLLSKMIKMHITFTSTQKNNNKKKTKKKSSCVRKNSNFDLWFCKRNTPKHFPTNRKSIHTHYGKHHSFSWELLQTRSFHPHFLLWTWKLIDVSQVGASSFFSWHLNDVQLNPFFQILNSLYFKHGIWNQVQREKISHENSISRVKLTLGDLDHVTEFEHMKFQLFIAQFRVPSPNLVAELTLMNGGLLRLLISNPILYLKYTEFQIL